MHPGVHVCFRIKRLLFALTNFCVCMCVSVSVSVSVSAGGIESAVAQVAIWPLQL